MINSKPTTLYLVRHAEYANPRGILPGRLPVSLSEQGVEQAKKLKEYFSDKKIDHIYSSAVLRCRETSEIIADGRVEISYDKRLLETFSAYQGYWKSDFDNLFSHEQELGGETREQIQERIVDFFQDLNIKSCRKFIICSHGDPLYFLHQQLIGNTSSLSHEEHEEYPSKASVRIIEISSEGITTVRPLIHNKDLR